MDSEWPDDWVSGADSADGTSITNDHGTLYLIDGDSYLWMSDVPPQYENRC